MKPGIPKPGGVDAAFRQVEKRLLVVKKRVNQHAARALKAGQYDVTNQWMEIGKLVADFGARADHFATEWRRVVRAAKLTHVVPDASPRSSPAASDWKCPIAGCGKVLRGSRGGWDAHIGTLRRHPEWHPDVRDAKTRRKLFQSEFPVAFGGSSEPRSTESAD